MDEKNKYKIELQLPFATKTIARIVYDVLKVDAEPKRSGVNKTLVLNDTSIQARFEASLARQLRVALTNFLEKVDLIVETVQCMGPPVSETYCHY